MKRYVFQTDYHISVMLC